MRCWRVQFIIELLWYSLWGYRDIFLGEVKLSVRRQVILRVKSHSC
jgi:hypothetical protein